MIAWIDRILGMIVGIVIGMMIEYVLLREQFRKNKKKGACLIHVD